MSDNKETLVLSGRIKAEQVRDGKVIAIRDNKQTIATVGKNWIVDLFQGIPASTAQIKFHKSGIGTTAAAAGNTNLETGIYTPVTGTRTEGASANIYRSVATVSYTGTRSVTEWGIFTSSATVAAGAVLISRKTFAALSVINGDSIQFTWDLTVG